MRKTPRFLVFIDDVVALFDLQELKISLWCSKQLPGNGNLFYFRHHGEIFEDDI